MARSDTVNIVVPCFNESERLSAEEFLSFVAERPWLRFTLVDDGSTDDTRTLLMSMARKSEGRIEALLLDVNQGKAEAVRQGIRHGIRSEEHWAIGFWDADLATPLKDIDHFVKTLKKNRNTDICMGSRVKLLGTQIDRDPSRHYFGRLAATAASTVLALRVYDTQCGAKIWRINDNTRHLFDDAFVTRWIFDVELLARWKKKITEQGVSNPEQRIIEIPLQTWTDVAGSKLTTKDMVQAPLELARIYWHYRRSL